jgi:hypothetical protein
VDLPLDLLPLEPREAVAGVDREGVPRRCRQAGRVVHQDVKPANVLMGTAAGFFAAAPLVLPVAQAGSACAPGPRPGSSRPARTSQRAGTGGWPPAPGRRAAADGPWAGPGSAPPLRQARRGTPPPCTRRSACSAPYRFGSEDTSIRIQIRAWARERNSRAARGGAEALTGAARRRGRPPPGPRGMRAEQHGEGRRRTGAAPPAEVLGLCLLQEPRFGRSAQRVAHRLSGQVLERSGGLLHNSDRSGGSLGRSRRGVRLDFGKRLG